MGGPGSGNFWHWHRPAKKSLVEDCYRLGVTFLRRSLLLRPLSRMACRVEFAGGRFAADLEVDLSSEQAPFAVLKYVTRYDPSATVEEVIPLTATRPHLGGLRWWFLCPGCGQRVGVLYRLPWKVRFRCRGCHGLVYDSQQNGHRDRAVRRWQDEIGSNI